MIDPNLQKIATQNGLMIECGSIGNKHAKVVILLESPNESDIKLQIPLSTASGSMVFKILEKYNIKRSDCYITCAVKRKLPMFQDKFKLDGTELLNWKNIIETELSDMPNIKYILCLGKYAMQIFNNEKSIVDWRGSIIDYNLHSYNDTRKVQLCFTFNPIMIFREPKWEVIFKFDLYKFYLLYSGQYREHYINHIINPTAPEALKYIYKIQNEKKPFALDIETIGNEMCCIGLANDIHEGICINFRDNTKNTFTLKDEINIKKAICRLLIDPNSKIITQNGSFDNSWLGYKERFPVFKCYFDTLLAHHTLYPRLPHNLGFLTSIYTMHPYYKDDGKTWKEGGDIDQYWRYNVKDVCITLAAYYKLNEELKQQKLDNFFYNHVMRIQPHLVNMCVQGVKVDLELREQINKQLIQDIDKVKTNFIEKLKKTFPKIPFDDFNINSVKDMGMLVYGFMKMPNFTNKRKVDEENIEKFINKDTTCEEYREILRLYLHYKKEMKFFSTYIDTKIDEDGRMRCEYKQYGTINAPGRLSSTSVLWGSGTNLQNQPQRAQQMFIADPGYGLLYFDLKQAEAKVVAYGWNVKKLIEAFDLCAKDPNMDVHRMNASNIFKVPYEEIPSYDRLTYGKTTDDPDRDGETTLRYLGKRCVHGLNYRMQADRLATTTGIDINLAREAFNSYHATYPEIQQAWKETIEELKKNKCLYNYMGRRLYFLEPITDNNMDSIIAFKPQSTIGDYVSSIIADVEEDPEFPKDKARCILNIHDALIFLYKLDVEDIMMKLIWKWANKPININGKDVVIGMDFKKSVPDEKGIHRWSNLKGVDYHG